MDDSKINTIQQWETPKKVYDVQRFVGFANFYRRFINGFSSIVQPLTNLTRKGTPWIWDRKCETAFNTLKKAFTTRTHVMFGHHQMFGHFTSLT